MTWPPATPFEQVLIRARGNDQPAIGMLYRRFQSAIFRYVVSRVADIPSAEDITSETFVAMIRGIGSTRATDELGFAAWLLGIARNQVLVHYRRTKSHPQVELTKSTPMKRRVSPRKAIHCLCSWRVKAGARR